MYFSKASLYNASLLYRTFLCFLRERFLVLNYPEKFDEALKKIGEWLFTGKIKVRSLITH